MPALTQTKSEIPGDVYYTAVLGLKVSLFDVSNVSDPKEISSVVIGDRGTTSDALADPKAILFDASRNLLVLPVELYLSTNSTLSIVECQQVRERLNSSSRADDAGGYF